VEEHHQIHWGPRRIIHSRNLVCVAGSPQPPPPVCLLRPTYHDAFTSACSSISAALKYGPVGQRLGLPAAPPFSSAAGPCSMTPGMMRFTGGKAMMTLGLLLFGSGIAADLHPVARDYFNAVLRPMLVIGVRQWRLQSPMSHWPCRRSADEDSGVVSARLSTLPATRRGDVRHRRRRQVEAARNLTRWPKGWRRMCARTTASSRIPDRIHQPARRGPPPRVCRPGAIAALATGGDRGRPETGSASQSRPPGDRDRGL